VGQERLEGIAGVVSLPACSGPCSVTSSGVVVPLLPWVLLPADSESMLRITVSVVVLFKLVTVEEQQFLREALYNTGILIVWDPAPYHAEIQEVRLSFL